jgi:predicted DNA-binding mobile mystery protein A
MKPQYKQMRIKQLSRSLAALEKARGVARPSRGWLRAIREALGISLAEVGQRTRTTKQGIQAFEKTEANDRITLRNLRRVAEAMDCVLIYAVVPKSGTIQDLAERRARSEATRRVQSVERSMALEGQAAGGVRDLIEEETKRIIKKP